MRFAALIAAALALAACSPSSNDQAGAPAAAAPSAVAPAAANPATTTAAAAGYTATAALAGLYYVADGQIDAGRVRFNGVTIRNARAFGAWTNGDRSGPPPISLEFIDEQAPGFDANADGPPDESTLVTIAPTTYSVADDRLEFTGSSPVTGEVRFSARVDAAVLARQQQQDAGDLTPVTGELTIGGRTYSNLRMSWMDPAGH